MIKKPKIISVFSIGGLTYAWSGITNTTNVEGAVVNHRPVNSRLSITCVVFLMFFVIGCSEKDTTKINSEVVGQGNVTDLLEQRVQGRWDALIQRDFERAYEFLTPAYRNAYDLGYYKRQFGDRVGWLSAEVKSIQQEGQVAQVIVSVRYKTLLPFAAANGQNVVESATFLSEKWIKEGEVWFYIKE